MGIIDDLVFGNALTKLTNVFVEIEVTRRGALIGAGGGYDSLPAGRRVDIGSKLPKWLATLRKRPPAEVTRELLKNMHVVQRTGNDLRIRAQARLMETLVSEGIAQHPDDFLSGYRTFTAGSNSANPSQRRVSEEQTHDFEILPTMPDYFRRKPVSGFKVGRLLVLFFESPEPIAKFEDIPLKYLFAATVYDSVGEKMIRVFTVETGVTPGVFFCAFEPTGEHKNIGPGEVMTRLRGFEDAVLRVVCRMADVKSYSVLNVEG